MAETIEHSQAMLESQALDFLRGNKPKMSKAEMNRQAKQKAKAAKRYAENLMASGTPEPAAWNQAIRLQILESETD